MLSSAPGRRLRLRGRRRRSTSACCRRPASPSLCATAWRARRRGVRVAQPLLRQRHQGPRAPAGPSSPTTIEAAVEPSSTRCSTTLIGSPRPTAEGVGEILVGARARPAYIEHLLGAVAGRRARGPPRRARLRQRRGQPSAAEVLAALGAEVEVIADRARRRPTSTSTCGSTHPERLGAAVREQRRRPRPGPRRGRGSARSPWTTTGAVARRRRADRALRPRPQGRAGLLAGDTVVVTVDDQPRASTGRWRRPASRSRDRAGG